MIPSSTENDIPRWRTRSTKSLASNPFLDIEEHHREEDGSGKTGDFIIIKSRDWVNICAITEGGDLVMIEQFRQGSETIELEVPGGIVDDGETPEATVTRELVEETGYVTTGASRVVKLGEVFPNPAFLDNRCHYYCVTNVRAAGETKFDEHENIRVRLVKRSEIRGLIAKGEIRHALVIGALFFLELAGLLEQ